MTETDNSDILDVELDILTDDVWNLDAHKLDPLVLKGWREMCFGALRSLVLLTDKHVASIDDEVRETLDAAYEWLSDADGSLDTCDEFGNFVDQCTANIAMAYARTAKVSSEHLRGRLLAFL